MRWDEGEVRGFAADHHALVDRTTAIELGASDAVIARRVKEGTWNRVYPGVFDLNVTPRNWVESVHAAVMAAGPHALASHRTAGVLWGLDGIKGRMLELTVPISNEPEPQGVIVHRTRRRLRPMLAKGIPVTCVERTLLDLAANLPPIVLEKAMMSAFHLRLTTPDKLALRLSQYGGKGVTGTRKLRRTLGLVCDGIPGSPSEIDVMAMMRSAPIPMPACQFEIAFPEGDHAYPDFAWPDQAKCIEIDGFDAHGSPDALERDLIRQNRLLELGWQMRRFSARRIRRDPARVLGEIVGFVNG